MELTGFHVGHVWILMISWWFDGDWSCYVDLRVSILQSDIRDCLTMRLYHVIPIKWPCRREQIFFWLTLMDSQSETMIWM